MALFRRDAPRAAGALGQRDCCAVNSRNFRSSGRFRAHHSQPDGRVKLDPPACEAFSENLNLGPARAGREIARRAIKVWPQSSSGGGRLSRASQPASVNTALKGAPAPSCGSPEAPILPGAISRAPNKRRAVSRQTQHPSTSASAPSAASAAAAAAPAAAEADAKSADGAIMRRAGFVRPEARLAAPASACVCPSVCLSAYVRARVRACVRACLLV